METKGLSGAEALLRVLRGMGVERIFASPGSEWAPVWEFLAKPYGAADAIPRYLSSRHEEIAVAMARAHARPRGAAEARRCFAVCAGWGWGGTSPPRAWRGRRLWSFWPSPTAPATRTRGTPPLGTRRTGLARPAATPRRRGSSRP